ncbi:MAG: hypothetical protein KJ053_12830 [Dehalococcoidia bacterium]|nr:hypothetical protein [Dehalococcoidia bacterium]
MDARAETNRQDHSRLLENLRRVAEAESVTARAAQWRNVSERRRSEVFAGLMRMSDAVARSRQPPYVKPPLNFPRFTSRPHER